MRSIRWTSVSYTHLLGFEPLGEPDARPVEDRAQVGLGVDVVDHPPVEIVGAQLPQLSFERVGALLRIARAQVLVVLPYGAEAVSYTHLRT